MTDPSAKTMPLYTPADLQAAVAAALEEVAPAKSFWLVPATLAVGLILGAIQHHLI
jgi:hypothetical protein